MKRSRYWPFPPRTAYVVSLFLVPILIALAMWLFRPNGPLALELNFGYLLVAIVLGMLPILLVVLGGVDTIQAAGVKVAFAAVQEVVDSRGTITARSQISQNLGTQPGRVTDSGSDTIIDSLRDATGNHSVVADLKEGEEWWETRLLVLVSGAARLRFPKAVVFTSSKPENSRRFLGWATPADLLRRLLAREPKLREAYLAAQRDGLLWQLGTDAPPGEQRLLPWAPAGNVRRYLAADAPLPASAEHVEGNVIEFPWPSPTAPMAPQVEHEDGFAPERLLLDHLQALEIQNARALNDVRVDELFGSVLHTETVDPEDSEDAWIEAILTSTADFFAVTRRQEFVNLVPRRAALNAVLLSLVSNRAG